VCDGERLCDLFDGNDCGAMLGIERLFEVGDGSNCVTAGMAMTV
jgi:hypothetical protein